MLPRYSLIGIAFSLAIILLDFYLIKKRRIQGKAFAFWFLVGTVLGLFSSVPVLYDLLFLFYGTQEVISAVTATTFLFLLLMLLYLHSRISELQSLLMKLAMEISLIKHDREKTGQESTKIKSENTEKQRILRKKREKQGKVRT